MCETSVLVSGSLLGTRRVHRSEQLARVSPEHFDNLEDHIGRGRFTRIQLKIREHMEQGH